jgi:hypothetical protein
MPIRKIPRIFGGTLILNIPDLPTTATITVATCRDGHAVAQGRDGLAMGMTRDGLAYGHARDSMTVATSRDGNVTGRGH